MRNSFLQSILIISVLIIFVFSAGCKSSKKNQKSTENNELSDTCSVKCNLEPDAGMCKAYFPRYYYDKDEKKCKEFIWGGCQGVVPFNTLEECENCGCDKGN